MSIWKQFAHGRNLMHHETGQSADLLRKPRSEGEIDLLLLDLDAEAWTRLITGGLVNGVIKLPVTSDIN